jgi:U3 small nucleolar RNA-associated protein 13
MAAAARSNDEGDSSSERSDEDNSVSPSVKDDEEEAGHSSSSEPSSDDDDNHNDGEDGSVEGSTGSSSAASSSTASNEDSGDDEMKDDEGFDQPEEDEVSSSELSERRAAATASSRKTTSNISAPAVLSKSWKALSTHVPMYTGGKFVVVPPVRRATETAPQSLGSSLLPAPPPLVLLPVGGNVALVNLRSGTVVAKLRSEAGTGIGGSEEEDDDDDGRGHDPDAITAFDCTSGMVVTCSHNSILRQYSIQYRRSEEEVNDGGHGDKGVAERHESFDGEAVSSAATGTKLARTIGRSGHALPVTVVKFHPSGVFFATGSLDGTVRVWDVRGMYCTHSFRWGSASEGAGVRSGVTCISWRDGDASGAALPAKAQRQKDLLIAIGREDGSIVVHDLMGRSAEAKPVAVLHDHVGAVTCLSWLNPKDVHLDQHLQFQKKRDSSSSSFILVSAGRDAVMNLWVNDRSVHTLPVYEQVEGLEVVPIDDFGVESDGGVDGGRIVIATAGSKGVVRVWRITASLRIEAVTVQVSGTSSADRGGYVAMQQYREYPNIGEEGDLTSTRLITANAEHNLSVLDANTLETTSSLVGHLDDILDVRILPSHSDSDDAEIGRMATVALATNSAEIRLMKVATSPDDIVPESSATDTLSGHTAAVLCLDVSPCQRYLLSCGKDRSVRIWDLAHQQCVGVAAGHTEAVGAAAFSRKVVHFRTPTSDQFAFCASVSVDRTLKRWNLPRSLFSTSKNHDPVSLSVASTVRAHEKDINMVSVAPNDSLIATASQDKTVRLWNASDLSLRATLKGHRRGVWDVQFSPVDRVVVTASGDKTLKLWSLTDYACVRYVLFVVSLGNSVSAWSMRLLRYCLL